MALTVGRPLVSLAEVVTGEKVERKRMYWRRSAWRPTELGIGEPGLGVEVGLGGRRVAHAGCTAGSGWFHQAVVRASLQWFPGGTRDVQGRPMGKRATGRSPGKMNRRQ